jgi:hypothetical protein
MRRHALLLTLSLIALLAPAATAGSPGQPTIALPDEFRPEGIASKGSKFYVGSIPLGAVYRGSYVTGEGDELVPPHPGRNHIGLKVARGLIFVAGGESKALYVYDARTGEDVAAFPLADAGFVNDVVVTRRAAYFTDSLVPQLYKLPIDRDGELGEVERIPLSGDFQMAAGFNLNGIEALGHRKLIVVQSNTGKLFEVDPRDGDTDEIPVSEPLTMGDGLLLHMGRLYVVRNRQNRVAVVDLDDDEAEVERYLTDPLLDVPTTIAPFGRSIYAVNARFDRPDDSDDDIIRLKAKKRR